MAKQVRAIPEGHHTVTPYLIVGDAAGALAFYKKAFGTEELMRIAAPNGKIGHAEIRIGDSVIMLADEHPDMNARGPHAFGGSPVSIHLYVEDVDAVAGQAIAAGATVIRPVQDQFYGDRSGSFTDPFGHSWHVATHKEDLTREELDKRVKTAMAQHGGD
jgi:PhnB protein